MNIRWLRRTAPAFFALFLFLLSASPVIAQAELDDNRVMLQGFYWESSRYGHPADFANFPNEAWYDFVKDHADQIQQARIDLIWLPPPCYCGDKSAGYNPKEYFKLDNSYGTQAQQRALLEALLKDGVEPVADLVLNHRDGETGWVDFQNPKWDTTSICADDEAFSNDGSGVKDLPADKRGHPEESTSDYAGPGAHAFAYASFRDIDQTNPQVHQDILRYMLSLKSLGYRGWRYDMVHGYYAGHIAEFNRVTKPTFSVGEYDWSAQAQQRGWVWYTAINPAPSGDDHLKTASDVFDFQTMFALRDAIDQSHYTNLYGFGKGVGLVGDTTDTVDWKNKAVTFVENHDTGYRTNPDGNPEAGHTFDTFANNWQVEQAYAQILTHPGVPCVYWKHYFEWGSDLQNKINGLINARKVAGINAGSAVHLQDNARARGVYAALIDGSNGKLYVRIGGDESSWKPSDSGYDQYREYVHGAGWQVWVGLPGNPDLQQAPLNKTLPEPPSFQPAETITPPTG